MKNTTQHRFVDDGYPEAEEYETTYIPWDVHILGTRKKAVAEATDLLTSRRSSRRIFSLGFRKPRRTS